MVRGGGGQTNTKTEGIVPIARLADGVIGRSSLHEHDVKCITFKFGVDPMPESLTVFMEALQKQWFVDTPPPCMMLLNDQSSEHRELQELPIIVLARMIDAGTAAISHVIASLRLGLVMHDHMVSGKTSRDADRGTREC